MNSSAQAKDEVYKDESTFVWFYIAAHYHALRLEWALQHDIHMFDDDSYREKLLSMMHDVQIEDCYSVCISNFAWKYANLVEKQIKVDLFCMPEPKTDTVDSIEEDGKVVHLVTGKKIRFSLGGLKELAEDWVNVQSRKRAPFKWTGVLRVKHPQTLTCRVWITDSELAESTTNKDNSFGRILRDTYCVEGFEPALLPTEIDLARNDLFDHRVDLSNEVHHHNGRYIKLRNQMSFRAQLKIYRTLQVAPQFWVIKIPNMLLKRSTEVCCDPHRKSDGPTSSCVRSTSIESHWQQVLGPIFIYSAGQWTQVPKLIQPVMLSLSRLSFLLPQGEIQKELSAILFSYIDVTMSGVDRSEKQRKDYCLDEPQMVDLVARNLLAYDSYLDVGHKADILEWICNRMKMVNVSSVYFTSSMLQYLHYLVHGIDRRRLSNKQVDLLCKVAKLAQWIGKMLDEDQKDLKQLVEEEQEEEDWTDEEEEEQEGEETQELSDSEESHSEMSETSQDETEVETQENPDADEPDQSVPLFCATARLRTMARKLNHKCARLLDELNDGAH